MVDTRKVTGRRTLEFSTMADILEDVKYLDSGDPPRAIGNWTSAQIVQHVAKLVGYSLDGFPVPKGPLLPRIVLRFMRHSALTKPMRPGIMFPHRFGFLAPDKAIAWEEAVDTLRRNIARVDTEKMKHPSPILGKLTHEQWVQMHCRHAEMHFSFIDAG